MLTCFRKIFKSAGRLMCLGTLAGVAVALAQTGSAPQLIVQPVNEAQLVTLAGNTHPLARPEFDQGAAPANLPMQRMLLLLKRSPQQDAALNDLLEEQQQPSSPNYHRWLTPEEFGQQFGVSDQDLQTVTAWLESHGFQIGQVAKGRNVVEFSGTAGQVEETFHTAIHQFVVNGKQHWANVTDPQIPVALAPAVAGVATLHNFVAEPQVAISNQRIGATLRPGSPSPEFNSGGTHLLAPADYATIYNISPVYGQGVTGAGTVIAIVGRTDINIQDVVSFRSIFGLSSNAPQIIHNGADPGDLGGSEEVEAVLDVTWSGAVAPGAHVDLVVSQTTNTTDGVTLSEEYIVNNNLANVMSESFGDCEANYTSSQAATVSSLAQQAAAEGITYTVSAGDSGSAGCDNFNSETSATGPISVNMLASTPYNIAVGGTQFNDNANPSQYWSASNGSTYGSALSYIPEDVWNANCTGSSCGTGSILAGGGGKSVFFTKPSWQSGVTGIPNDGARDLPDVVLAAAGHTGYLLCVDGSCTPNNGQVSFYGVYGTSAAAPSFAGMMALVNQSTGSRQGQANSILYPLATKENLSNCNASNTAALPASTCIFNDVTVGTNAVPGESGYGTSGETYLSTVGYDLASGLGSVNVANLVSQWNTALAGPPTQGLVGYWKFDEDAGNLAHDSSGNGYTGTISGATWTTGKINSALSFNGSNSEVVTSAIPLGNAFSISAWVNPAVTPEGGYVRIAETQYNGGFYLGTTNNGSKYQFIVNTGSGATGSCGVAFGCAEGGSVTSGWHLVTGTFDGSHAVLYVDGAQVASETFTAPGNTSFPLYIGQYYAGSGYGWNGAIDEVRLYGRALAASEVTSIYTYTGGGSSDTTPPTVSITAPANNATVSNIVTVSANASDNVAVAQVQFQLDGSNLGAPLTGAPYSMSWNTATVGNGTHTLTAIATDTSNNSTTSSPVTVTVSNTTTSPPTQGLVGYWNFDEGSGSVAHDTSGNGYNGTINGATWTTGKINSALSFNGSTNDVVASNIPLGNTFSISAWVNPATTSQTGYARIAETQYNGGFYLGTTSNGSKYQFIVNTGSGATGSCGVAFGCAEGGAVTSGWHLVTGTFDGSHAILYVDGSQVATETFTAPGNTNFPLYVGRYYASNGYGWNGIIDEVRLYNRALAATEVIAIYNYTGGGSSDTTPPTVSITAPANNATVSNIVTVSANASDNVAVAQVQFQLDGSNLGTPVTASPYSISWNTATATNGSHTLTAIATDTSNNSATSSPVTVTVSNAATSPPTQGLVGYWNFDEDSGSVAHDSSGNGYTGTITAATWTTGKFNSALSFSGSTSKVVTLNISLGNAFSISAWVNPATSPQVGYARIAETQYNGGFYLGTNVNGTEYQFIVNTGAGATGSCGVTFGCAVGGAVTSGWHLVTGTFDGTHAILYVDGSQVASETYTAPGNTNFPLYVAQYYGGPGYGWNGVIDEVRLYNRALSATEVEDIFLQ